MAQTPTIIKFSLQPGHIAISKNWRDHIIFHDLCRLFNSVKVYDLAGVDFYLPNLRIIYLSEGTFVTTVNVDVLIRANPNIIIADRNTVTVETFSKLQVDVLQFALNVLPVGHVNEVALLLHQLSLTETVPSPGSTFRNVPKLPHDIQLQIIQTIPGLGMAKAKKLLDAFGTVQRVAFATVGDLIPIVGVTSASQVHRFFNSHENS